MAKIVIERAPPTALPLLFLRSTPGWGVVAGALLVLDADAALQSRWAPMTLALVHAFTLGVLGNAMLGSLLQFLPAAAGARVRGGAIAGRIVYALFNLGTALLVLGLRTTQPVLLVPAGLALACALALFAGMVLPGLVAPHRANAQAPVDGPRATRRGIVAAVLALLATATLGLGLLWGFSGHAGLPPLPWTDVHAAWGLLGWGVMLVASVGAVVLPMFQGARTVPARALHAGLAGIGLVLAAGTLEASNLGSTRVLGWGSAACVGVLGMSGLWLQWRARYTRNAWLVRAWRAGLLALVAGAVAMAIGAQPLWVGVLLLAIGFPWLVAGMQLEIVAFLGWIELHRRCGRGVRLPPVQALLPEVDKGSVFVAFAIAALVLLVATAWPPAARLAGVAMLVSHALLGWRLHGVGRRVQAFLTNRTFERVEAIHAG